MLLALVLSGLAFAEPDAAQMKKAFCPFQKKAAKALFTPFLEHPEEELGDAEEVLALQADLYGPCSEIRLEGKGKYRLVYRDAEIPLRPRFDDKGIFVLEYGAVKVKNDSPEKLGEFFRKRWPEGSLSVQRDGQEIFAINSSRPLNVGAAARVFLLRALRETGTEKTVSLRAEDKTPFYSLIDSWVPGTKITTDTLKNLVFSDSDYTAFDLLLEAIGREPVEKFGNSLKPFPSYGEYGRILAIPAKEARGKNREELLAQARAAKGPGSGATRVELAEKAGWFASTKEVCESAYAVREEPVFFAGPGGPAKEWLEAGWEKTGTVQARAEGISQSLWLFRRGGETLCFSLGWNGKQLPPEDLVADISTRIHGIFSVKPEDKKGR